MRTTLSKALFGIANGGPRLEPVGFDTAAIERHGARIQPARHDSGDGTGVAARLGSGATLRRHRLAALVRDGFGRRLQLGCSE